MKITRLSVAALAAALVVLPFIGAGQASAATYVDVRIGPNGPPPPVVEHRWAAPYRTAVWVPGYHEWVRGRYVWRSGYYTYPPRRGGYWVAPRYIRHSNGIYYYRAGHWAY